MEQTRMTKTRGYTFVDIIKVLFVTGAAFFVFLKAMFELLALYFTSMYIIIPGAVVSATFFGFCFLVLAVNLAGTDMKGKE